MDEWVYKEIVVSTFDNIFGNFNALLQKLLIPIVLISIIDYYLPLTLSKEHFTQLSLNSIENLYVPLALILLLILCNIAIAITVYRVIILGEDYVPKFGSSFFGLRELKFLTASIVMSMLIFLFCFLFVFIPLVGPFIVFLLALLLASRYSLVYPAIACDEKMNFFDSWRYTKKHKLLIFFVVFIFPLLFAIPVSFVYSLAIEFLVHVVSSKLTFLYSLLNIFIVVFCISALASAYVYIKPQPLNPSLKKTIRQKKRNYSFKQKRHA